MSNRALLRFFALLAVFAVIAAACGDDDTATNATETPTEAGGDSPAPEETGGTDPAPEETGDTDPAPEAVMVGGVELPASPNADPVAADDSLDPIVIGWVDQTSGVPTFPGGINGIATAERYINTELGGVNGHPIQFETCDTTGTEEGGLACGQEFVNNDDIFAVTPGLVIATSSLLSTLNSKGIVYMSGGPFSPPELVDPAAIFLGGGVFTLAAAVAALVPLAIDLEGTFETVTLINSDNAAGISAGDVTAGLLEGSGFEVKRAQISDTAVDAAPTIIAGDVENSDALVVLVSQQQCIQIANTLNQLQIDIPVATAGTCVDEQVKAGLGGSLEALEGWYVVVAPQTIGLDETDDINELLYAVGTYAENPGDIEDLEEEAAQQSGSLTTAIMMRRFLLEEPDPAVWFTPEAGDKLRAAFESYDGGIWFGGPGWECPGAWIPSVCGFHSGAVVVDSTGEFAAIEGQTGTLPLDLRDILALLPS